MNLANADTATIHEVRSGRRPRYSLRTLLLGMLIFAMALGWLFSIQQASRERSQWERKLRFVEAELNRSRDEVRHSKQRKVLDQRPFWQADLSGMCLVGMFIRHNENAFQEASLRECNLEDATLIAGAAAFQAARFDRAMLEDARLVGGVSSFQLASFDDADLTRASLAGGSGSFQIASFDHAILVDATLQGSFQNCNINHVQFEGADLSALQAHDLASCYFDLAPTYDSKTRFPVGFDPKVQQWKRVDEKVQ